MSGQKHEPIEVGLSWIDDDWEIQTFYSQIRPAPEWPEEAWSQASTLVHNIPRSSFVEVAAQGLLKALGGRIALSDAPPFERHRLDQLLGAAGVTTHVQMKILKRSRWRRSLRALWIICTSDWRGSWHRTGQGRTVSVSRKPGLRRCEGRNRHSRIVVRGSPRRRQEPGLSRCCAASDGRFGPFAEVTRLRCVRSEISFRFDSRNVRATWQH